MLASKLENGVHVRLDLGGNTRTGRNALLEPEGRHVGIGVDIRLR